MKKVISSLVLALFVIQTAVPVAYADPTRPRPRPRPTPTATPTPTPTATPTPTPRPTPTYQPDTGAARRQGEQDGRPDGGREGRERGDQDGREDGRRAGYDEGYRSCEATERQRHYDAGYQYGYDQGLDEGRYTGNDQGRMDGEREGDRQGSIDGRSRADSDAKRDATPPGRAKGIDEANQSDADNQGYQQGLIDGDADALAHAKRTDYPRGRKDLKNEREAEAIAVRESFSQKPVGPAPTFETETRENKAVASILGFDHSRRETPNYKYSRPNRNYPTPQEDQAYREGYRNGYEAGFHWEYDSNYRSEYNQAHRRGIDDGCRAARNADYRPEYDRGFVEGRRRGYTEGYDGAYRYAYRPAYDQAFRSSSDQAYNSSYDGYYNDHYESARRAAYQTRYGEIYSAAHDRGHTEKYNAMYPGYAQQQYQLGRDDEAADFDQRPVRLTNAEVTETIPNGLYEPGETLRVKFSLRNFAAGVLAGRDVKLKIEAMDADAAVITESEAVLVQDLKGKSLTEVTDALDFRFNESVVGRAKRFVVSVTYQGRAGGEKSLELVPNFQVDTVLPQTPTLQEGMPTVIRFKIKNQSQTATESGLVLNLVSDPTKIEIKAAELRTGVLAAGEERTVEFTVVARASQAYVKLPLALDVKLATGGRRVGLLDETRSVPVLNDYRIRADGSAVALRKAGVTRIPYTISNINSRLILRGLQVNVRFKGTNTDLFKVIGPNPQYLAAIRSGKSRSFVIPVLATADNDGAMLEIEVQEDGKTVVIHQLDFEK